MRLGNDDTDDNEVDVQRSVELGRRRAKEQDCFHLRVLSPDVWRLCGVQHILQVIGKVLTSYALTMLQSNGCSDVD